MLSKDSYIITIIYWQHSTNFLSWLKTHNRCREFFETQNKLFLDLFDAILISQKYKIIIMKMQSLGKDDFSFESELFFEVDRWLRHISCSKIFKSLHCKLPLISNDDQLILVMSIDEIKCFFRDILNSCLIQYPK